MSAGMAEVIAAHIPAGFWNGPENEADHAFCECGWEQESLGVAERLYAAHVAEALTKAGYGNVREAIMSTADAMEADPQFRDPLRLNSDRLRMYAHTLDPDGHALVKAIHDRKAVK